MIVFDTETSGLISNSIIPGQRQPRIIDLVCLKLDDVTFEEQGFFRTGLLDPGVAIEEDAIKTHGVTNDMVKGKPIFASVYPKLAQFFFGQQLMVAHNLAFDRDMIYYELLRMGKQLNFPWPIDHVCTVEQTEHIKGYRLKLIDLHVHLFGEEFKGAHDAEQDVRALARCYVECRKQGIIIA